MTDHQIPTGLPAAPLVETRAGTVSGVLLGESNAAYLGIPYAEAPTGPLRFAAPVRRSPWDGVHDGGRYGATPLLSTSSGITAIPEPAFAGDDTLLVNVFTPRPGEPDAALPVFVWIHGGGFTTGSPSSPWYAGGAFPRDGVVVVSVSYRLGFDGFGVMDGAPDNRAVRDWILALEWVRDEIAAFGGDPARVTIGGQSAGGTAVLTLLAVPSAQGLFAGAIAESPASTVPTREAAREHTRRLAEQLGVAPTRDGFATVDARAVVDAQDALARDAFGLGLLRGLVRGTRSFMNWVPVVDGELLPVPLDEAHESGTGADVPLLVGATANEVDLLAERMPAPVLRLPRRATALLAGFGPRDAGRYARATPGDRTRVLGRIVTDATFRFEVARAILRRADRGIGHERGAHTWVYDFRYPSATTGAAGHCIELPFVWDVLDGENVVSRNTGEDPPQSLADDAHAAWVRFIVEGDPGWPEAGAEAPIGRVFDAVPSDDRVFEREVGLIRPRVDPRN